MLALEAAKVSLQPVREGSRPRDAAECAVACDEEPCRKSGGSRAQAKQRWCCPRGTGT